MENMDLRVYPITLLKMRLENLDCHDKRMNSYYHFEKAERIKMQN